MGHLIIDSEIFPSPSSPSSFQKLYDAGGEEVVLPRSDILHSSYQLRECSNFIFDNCKNGKWGYFRRVIMSPIDRHTDWEHVFIFSNPKDAILFKMRWS